MAKIYAIVVGAGLTVIGILGFVMDQLRYSASHNTLHLVSGLVGLTLGFGSNGRYAKVFAQAFGVVYTLVALLGFAHIPVFIVSMLNLNAGSNLIHLALGLVSFWVGFGAKQKRAAVRP
jgi:hypothetical protein